MNDSPETTIPVPSRPLWMFAPAAVALLVGGAFGWGLFSSSDNLPSTLLGKPVPEFSLPPVQGRELGFSHRDLQGEVSVVNVFASWCVPCRIEHPLFMELASSGIVPIYGINYKDEPAQAEAWLAELGDPYTRTGSDIDGRVGIDWGVYGVPETFIVNGDGMIVYKHVGPLSRQDIDEEIQPLIQDLQANSKTEGNQ